MVLHETHQYSMDPDSLGIPGTLHLYRDRVRVVAGRYEATHRRLFGPPAKSTLPEHRAQRVAAASGKRAKRYMQREHLLGLGREALEYLTELTHRRPRVWVRDVDRLHHLLDQHGEEAMRAAFGRGLAEQAIGAEYIAHYLGDASPGLPFDPTADRPPTIAATRLPRGGRVQVADGARRGGAQRSTWTRPSTAVRSRRVGGRS
jgi:hypothetical protein